MKSREIAAFVVTNVLNNSAYSNIFLSEELNKSNLEDKDKALVTEIVYGTIKYKYTIDTILKEYLKNGLDRLEPEVLNVLRTAIYQIKYLDKIPEFAVVNEAVDITKEISGIGASKLVNGVLRNYLRNKDDNNYYKDEYLIDRLCYVYSFEKWMVELFINQYGRELAEKILSGLNNIPEVTVRVNNVKNTFEEAYDSLEGYGYNIKEGHICSEAISILRGRSIESNPLFIEGKITVQDESAMLAAISMNIKEGQMVMDLCSAPGGKTTHISELMNNTGSIKAFDVHENKLKLIKENYERLGLNNISCEVMDATIFNSQFVDTADSVLIDVPCSGLGIIRKKPEIKWTKSIKEIQSLIKIQRDILNNASKYVKPGGVLLYSTCTLNKKENEDNIKLFLKQNSNYKIEPLFFGELDNIIYSKEGFITIVPNAAMDGFFIAKLRRY